MVERGLSRFHGGNRGVVPRSELGTMVDRLFGDFWNEVDHFMFPSLWKNEDRIHKFSYPRLNIVNSETECVIEAAVPGLTKEDIKVEYANNSLSISGASKQDEKVEKNGYVVRELHKSSFSRTIPIDEELCDVEKISAGVENGVLTVKIPKKVLDTASPRRIIEVE